MNGNKKEKQNQWFDEIDERVVSFKHKVHNWLKDVALEEEKGIKTFFKAKFEKFWTFQEKLKFQQANPSLQQLSLLMSHYCSSKERAAVGKAKLAEMMMEAEFLEKKQTIQRQAEKLKIEEKLAKAQARSQIFAAMKGDHSLRGSLMSLNKDDHIMIENLQLLMIKIIEELSASSTH